MNPKCSQCEKTESILWRKNSENGEICNDCYESEKSEPLEKEVSPEQDKDISKDQTATDKATASESKVRKSTRSTRFNKNKANTRQKSKITSRRSNTFKSVRPSKTPTNISAETKTKSYLFYEGFYFQSGDIVSLMCRGKKYYAQIRSLIIDPF